MTNSPALTFPCEFPLKIMGRDDMAFRQAAVEIVQRHMGASGLQSLSERPSKNNRFVALTITIRPTSQAQLDGVYRALTAHDAVVMVL